MINNKTNPVKIIYRTKWKESKKQLCLTGTILAPIIPGNPAIYICNGKKKHTSKVASILEAAPTYVMFETLSSIYVIKYENAPVENHAVAG